MKNAIEAEPFDALQVLGYNGQAMRVEGVDEYLTGSPEEYLVPLNGLYLRQGKEDDVNGRSHFVLATGMQGLWEGKGLGSRSSLILWRV